MAKEIKLKLKEGDVAPGFSATTSGGGKISLADFLGKNVILYFYPKDDTPGCTKEACAFRDHFADFKKRGAVVLGVSTDSVKSHDKFVEKFKLPFTLLADEDKKIVEAYGVWGEKSFMGRKYHGHISRDISHRAGRQNQKNLAGSEAGRTRGGSFGGVVNCSSRHESAHSKQSQKIWADLRRLLRNQIMSEIFVIGHRNPDTDAICSAIGYAEFKRRTGMPEAVAARCGDTNERIDFVLNTFGVPSPRFVADVSPKVRDVMRAEVLSVTADATAAEALGLMDEHDIRVLPVLDAEQRCRGLLSLFKLSKFLFPAANRLIDSRRVLSSLNNLARTLGGKILTGHETDREEDLILMISAMRIESFAQRLERYPPEKLALVVGDRTNVQELAIRKGVRVLIVTGGLAVEPHVLEAAKQNRVSLITSPHDTSTTASLCRSAVAIRHMLHEKFLSFREERRWLRSRPMRCHRDSRRFR